MASSDEFNDGKEQDEDFSLPDIPNKALTEAMFAALHESLKRLMNKTAYDKETKALLPYLTADEMRVILVTGQEEDDQDDDIPLTSLPDAPEEETDEDNTLLYFDAWYSNPHRKKERPWYISGNVMLGERLVAEAIASLQEDMRTVFADFFIGKYAAQQNLPEFLEDLTDDDEEERYGESRNNISFADDDEEEEDEEIETQRKLHFIRKLMDLRTAVIDRTYGKIPDAKLFYDKDPSDSNQKESMFSLATLKKCFNTLCSSAYALYQKLLDS